METNIKEKSFALCSGLDMVNVNLLNVVCKDKETCEKWVHGLDKIILNVKMNNACPKVNLQKQ